MDYEQKYKKALDRAKKELQTCSSTDCDAARQIFRLFPELAESEDEKIRKELIEHIKANSVTDFVLFQKFSPDDVIAWLEKQGEQILANSTKTCKEIPNELEECEIEHGKYYYCIKDYYAGGNKRASKGDIIQALNGMSMMDLGVRANEYFMPINNIEQKTTLSEDDKGKLNWVINVWNRLRRGGDTQTTPSQMKTLEDWLKSLKDRIGG